MSFQGQSDYNLKTIVFMTIGKTLVIQINAANNFVNTFLGWYHHFEILANVSCLVMSVVVMCSLLLFPLFHPFSDAQMI